MNRQDIIKNIIIWIQKIQQKQIKILIGLFFLGLYLVGDFVTQAAEPIYPPDQFECDTCNEYQLDFLYLVKLLQDSHSNVYANFPKEDFEQEQARMLKELETLEDVSTFALLLQQFCARIADAHTKINTSHVLQNSQYIFPVGFTVLQDDFYLTAFDTGVDMKYLGAKVLAVNGMPMPQVIPKLGRLASCENDTCRKQIVRDLLQEPKTLEFIGIISDNERLRLTVTTRDGAEQMLTRPRRARKAIEWAAILKKEYPVTARKGAEFHYKIFPEKQLCYFQFNEFRDRQTLKSLAQSTGSEQFKQQYGIDPDTFPNFGNFLQQMFDDIQQKHITYLIIDLRSNQGGDSMLGTQIMYYLQGIPDTLKSYVGGMKLSPLMRHQYPDIFEEEKQCYEEHYGKDTLRLPVYIGDRSTYKVNSFVKERTRHRDQFFAEIEKPDSFFYIAPPSTRFSGKVLLLIGSGTFSAASDFATTLHDNQLATLIGQPISQKPTSFGDKLYFQLPHTDIEGSVSYKMFYRPDATKDDEPTLYPDIEVWPTIDDILNGNDPVFDKVLELIELDKGQ